MNHGSAMCVPSSVRRVPARLDDSHSNLFVLVCLPKCRRPARLNLTEMLAPLRMCCPSGQRRTNGGSMFPCVEILTVILLIVQANVLRGFQSRNIGRLIVAAIEIHMMSMSARGLIVDFVP